MKPGDDIMTNRGLAKIMLVVDGQALVRLYNIELIPVGETKPVVVTPRNPWMVI